jgi:phospholipid-binding lipoprotein MlaA
MQALFLSIRIICILFLTHVCLPDFLHAEKSEAQTKKQESTKGSNSKKKSLDDDDDDVLDEPDPLEPVNRVTFAFNRVIDGLILKPFAALYEDVVNDTAKEAVRNVVSNAFEPVGVVNHSLQGEGERAGKTVARFVINTTVGFFGLMDAADGMGLPKATTSMNETFATWGIGTGPYIVLPVLGPSSLRDTVGKVGDYYSNPFYYITRNKHRAHNRHRQQWLLLEAIYGLDALERRRQVLGPLRDLERMSSDFYVGMRSVFFQKQAALEKKVKDRRKENELKPT